MANYLKSLYVDADLDTIWLYIARDNEEAASRVVHAAHATFEMLARNPGAGRVRPRTGGFQAFPVSGFPNSLIFYRQKDGTVEIHPLLHGAQDLRKLLEQ